MIKTGINGIKFDFSGMEKPSGFISEGYKILAMSTNGANKVTSYIAKIKGKEIYGYYDYQKAVYIEEKC